LDAWFACCDAFASAANKVMPTKIDPRRFNARGSEIY
jgi:hypothetical protein